MEDVNSSPAHSLSSPHPARSEIFQLVMDHLPGFFSGARPPAKTKTGQPREITLRAMLPDCPNGITPGQSAISEAPAQKKDSPRGVITMDLNSPSDTSTPQGEAGKSGVDAARGGNPPILQAKSDLAPTSDVFIPSAPWSNDSGRKSPTGRLYTTGQANLKTESSGVVADGFGRGKTNAGLTPATAALSRILNETDSRPADSSTPAKKCMDLPAALLPVAGGAPCISTVRSASQAFHAEPVSSVPWPSSRELTGELLDGGFNGFGGQVGVEFRQGFTEPGREDDFG